MFGNVTYASRSLYAQRDEMLYEHATRVAGSNGTVMWADDIIGEDLVVDEDTTYGNCSRRVMIVKEGAGTVQALLGKKGLPLSCFCLSFMTSHDFFYFRKKRINLCSDMHLWLIPFYSSYVSSGLKFSS
jgi:hypothetical protein